MIPVQFDMFEENDELSLLKKELSDMRDSFRRQSKAQFAMLNNIGKTLIECKEEIHNARMSMIHRTK